jgi:hypothetical protein
MTWLFGVLLAVATLVGGYATVRPRILVEPPIAAANSDHPYASSFLLSNAGWLLPIYDVQVKCRPGLEGTFAGPFDVGAPIRSVAFNADRIELGGQREIICKVLGDIQTSSSTVTITRIDLFMDVSFRPIRFIPWSLSKEFTFVMDKAGDRKYLWSRLRLGEKSLEDEE